MQRNPVTLPPVLRFTNPGDRLRLGTESDRINMTTDRPRNGVRYGLETHRMLSKECRIERALCTVVEHLHALHTKEAWRESTPSKAVSLKLVFWYRHRRAI